MITETREVLVRRFEQQFNTLLTSSATPQELTNLFSAPNIETAVLTYLTINLKNLGIKVKADDIPFRHGVILCSPVGHTILLSQESSSVEQIGRVLHSVGHIKYKHVPRARRTWDNLFEVAEDSRLPLEEFLRRESQADRWARTLTNRSLKAIGTPNPSVLAVIQQSLATLLT